MLSHNRPQKLHAMRTKLICLNFDRPARSRDLIVCFCMLRRVMKAGWLVHYLYNLMFARHRRLLAGAGSPHMIDCGEVFAGI
jgi:hypothetical protein